MAKIVAILKSKKAETLLEAVLSVLIFALVILGVASMTGTAQKIAASTQKQIEEFDAMLVEIDGGMPTVPPTLIAGPSPKAFNYKLAIGAGSLETYTFTPDVRWVEDGDVIVSFEKHN